MIHRSPIAAMSLAAIGVVAAASFVGAQTAIQRPRTVNPAITNAAKIAPVKPPSSMMNMRLPDPMPAEPDWQDKHAPLTLHVADSSLPGRGTMVSVSKADGSGFYDLKNDGTVQVYSPYYSLKRMDKFYDDAVFVFGNDTVECKVTANLRANLMRLTLACQRNDPDIAPNETLPSRPFFVLVTRKDPSTGFVMRGEAMVTLTGYVVDKP